MYRKRMNSYYPEVVRSILEFRAIIDAEYPEVESMKQGMEDILSDAYLTTMKADRIVQWENILGIQPLEDSTINDRRDTIIARIRGQGKLNTELINTIVKTFTGGTANSWVEDGVLYVEITPPPNDKTYKFQNVEQEIKNKVPAHLGCVVSRNYYDWQDVKSNYNTWNDVLTEFGVWNEVLLYNPF